MNKHEQRMDMLDVMHGQRIDMSTEVKNGSKKTRA